MAWKLNEQEQSWNWTWKNTVEWERSGGHMQMSMRNGVTPKLKLTLTLTDTEGAVLTLMLGYRSLYITWQHHNCRIVCEFSLRILICILPRSGKWGLQK